MLERHIIDGEVWEGAESTKKMISANQNRFQPIKLIFRVFLDHFGPFWAILSNGWS